MSTLSYLIHSFLLAVVHFIVKVINTVSAACHSLTAVLISPSELTVAVMLVTDSSFSSCDPSVLCVFSQREKQSDSQLMS